MRPIPIGDGPVLMEAAIVERLRRSSRVELHPRLVHALVPYDGPGRRAMLAMFKEYVEIARRADLPLVLCSPSWRANRERVEEMSVELDLNGDAVRMLKEFRAEQGEFASRILIGGLIGCKNDCYRPDQGLSVDEARRFHAWQIDRLAAAEPDFLMATTMPAIEEAMGLAAAMVACGIPAVVSFVIGRDGRVLDGTTLSDAIAAVDDAVAPRPAGYMVNCAYPSFLNADGQPRELFDRLIGFQANASSLDHAELDGAGELKSEPVLDWGERMVELHREFGLSILGGCCGTGPEHLREIVRRLDRFK